MVKITNPDYIEKYVGLFVEAADDHFNAFEFDDPDLGYYDRGSGRRIPYIVLSGLIGQQTGPWGYYMVVLPDGYLCQDGRRLPECQAYYGHTHNLPIFVPGHFVRLENEMAQGA